MAPPVGTRKRAACIAVSGKVASTVVLSALVNLAATGCLRTAQYGMGQPIEMGPFTFSVASANQGKRWESADGTVREIEVHLRVHRDDSAPFTVEFSSFVGTMEILDEAGNRISASPTPVAPTYQGGRYRSTRYWCRFRFSRSLDGVRNFAAIGTRPADFRLLVENPAPAGEQPHRVSVQLQ